MNVKVIQFNFHQITKATFSGLSLALFPNNQPIRLERTQWHILRDNVCKGRENNKHHLVQPIKFLWSFIKHLVSENRIYQHHLHVPLVNFNTGCFVEMGFEFIMVVRRQYYVYCHVSVFRCNRVGPSRENKTF